MMAALGAGVCIDIPWKRSTKPEAVDAGLGGDILIGGPPELHQGAAKTRLPWSAGHAE